MKNFGKNLRNPSFSLKFIMCELCQPTIKNKAQNASKLSTIEIPSSNGHEQAGLRPAIIVQAPQFEKKLSTGLIVPLTSQLAAQTFPSTFLIHSAAENSLTVTSVALVFQLRCY